MMKTIVYRGIIDWCNYDCHYCPFSKNKYNKNKYALDQKYLSQFIEWVTEQHVDMQIMFMPYGETLIFKSYQEALLELAELSHVKKIVIQTNLSCTLQWLERNDKIALWCSFHPLEVQMNDFVQKSHELRKNRIYHSVGAVGVLENKEIIREIREKLPNDVYLWVNAFKMKSNYYCEEDTRFFEKIDPYFRLNLQNYFNRGKSCLSGQSTYFMYGNGKVRKCLLDKTIIGNMYDNDLLEQENNAVCKKTKCDCYMSYVHIPTLSIEDIYGTRVLERIPIEYQTWTS